MKKKMINLGCGKDIKKGYINIDKFDLDGVDLVMDLENARLPFPDSSIDEIYASHLLEHIFYLYHLMEECWRVLKPKAKMMIEVPYFRSFWADVSPGHKKRFGVWTWYTFAPDNPENYLHKAKFKTNKIRLFWCGKKHIAFYPFELIINSMQKFYEEFFSHLFPVEFMSVELEAVKG